MNEEWVSKAVIGIIGLLVTWGTWITNRAFAGLSRADHEALCESRQKQLDDQLKAIHEKQDKMMDLLVDVIRKGG